MQVFIERKFAGIPLPEGVRRVALDNEHRAGIEVAVCGRAMARKLAAMDLPKLKLVQLTSAGFDGVPLDEFSRKGIRVANAAGVYGVPIAETVVFGMLQMAKRYRRNPNDRRVKFARGYSRIGELSGKTVLILGAGHIGTEIAKRLAGFQMNVLGYDVQAGAKAGFVRIVGGREELGQALGGSDYVVCTLPDTEETRGLVDAELIRHMKSGAVFVNVGRRAVLNEPDLYRALKSGQLGGAVLDMFEWFPNPVTNPFRRLDNVIAWPGVAAISRESGERLRELIVRNLAQAARGEEPEHVVNRGAFHG